MRTDSAQFGDATEIEHILWLKELLTHRWNQVRAARQHPNITCVFCERGNSIVDRARPQQPELREAQSAPPAGPAACRRAGSSACRSGPLPLKQSDPPCSRKRAGAVGSTPSVSVSVFCFLFARSAAITRSGVKGDSCKRTPTAS